MLSTSRNSNKLLKMYRRQDRNESPRPTKRRNSGPYATASGLVPLTPRQTPLTNMDASLDNANKKQKMQLLPKTPLAPRPFMAPALTETPPDSFKPEIFVPAFDLLDAPPMPMAASAPSFKAITDTAPSASLTSVPLPLAAAGRLKPRRVAPRPLPQKCKTSPDLDELLKNRQQKKSRPMSPLEAIASVKDLHVSKAVPAPSRKTLKQSRSCHALCA